ncbi:MAG: hypothetical protein AVDCRST_MAG74-762, partial [uncultured Pyrinomonadaceae bacterium]
EIESETISDSEDSKTACRTKIRQHSKGLHELCRDVFKRKTV